MKKVELPKKMVAVWLNPQNSLLRMVVLFVLVQPLGLLFLYFFYRPGESWSWPLVALTLLLLMSFVIHLEVLIWKKRLNRMSKELFGHEHKE